MGHFSYLRSIIRQHQAGVLERELRAACCQSLGSHSGLRSTLRSPMPSALEAAEGFFYASIVSTILWSLLILIVRCR